MFGHRIDLVDECVIKKRLHEMHHYSLIFFHKIDSLTVNFFAPINETDFLG